MYRCVRNSIAVQISVDQQPLQFLATMRVAILVCEAEDMQNIIRTFYNPGPVVGLSDDQWRRLRSKGRSMLHRIRVPDLIIDIILEKLWTISFEIFKWISYHVEDTGIDCSSAFSWTPHFAIDYVKTAGMLIKNETLDIIKRFKMACFYCLGSEVRYLWRMMDLSKRRLFFVRGNLKEPKQNLIVLYWTYYIQEVRIDYWACDALKHKKLYKYSVQNGYLSATTYFFKKLSMQDRIGVVPKSLDIYLPHLLRTENINIVKDHLAIACFLVCQEGWLGDNDQLGLVVRFFLEWPWQKHFMTIFNKLRTSNSKRIFGKLLKAIFEKEMNDFHDYDYKELFREFWLQSPENWKMYVNTETVIGFFLLHRFVQKHFPFVFEEQSYDLKKKFRDILFEQNGSENVTNFEAKNVEFFGFLVRAQVATRDSIQRRTTIRFPLEILSLVDGLMGSV